MTADANTFLARPLLWVTVLLSAVALSACVEEGCNITGPSEGAGSDGTTDLFVRVGQLYADSVQVSVRGSNLTVARDKATGIVVKVAKGGLVSVFVPQQGEFDLRSGSCRWSGITYLNTDPLILIEPASFEIPPGLLPPPPSGSRESLSIRCRNW